ncbi:hypothetical protein PHPALM_30597 [Phytophthora palmivora]|uniref:Uncharacterized protein n=1 Tax=Phytophthora palmivora TaxID=4796 RepID=A0A2P4X4R5_9STRA|nr:hypothetical protein PHPALM_30597 [Phytophthora palmivora]
MYERMESNGLGWKSNDGVLNRVLTKWQAFGEYFERTWIDGYAVELWSVHGMANELVARTNNPLEHFNRELNTRFPTPHPSMATFVTTIRKISAGNWLTYPMVVHEGFLPR